MRFKKLFPVIHPKPLKTMLNRKKRLFTKDMGINQRTKLGLTKDMGINQRTKLGLTKDMGINQRTKLGLTIFVQNGKKQL